MVGKVVVVEPAVLAAALEAAEADQASAVVRHAAPLDDRARAQLREQHIAALRRDDAAVEARERRIALGRRPCRVLPMRPRTGGR